MKSARQRKHAEPTRITVAHWGRLHEGELFAKTRYIDWAILMKRSFGLDVLRCPRCGRSMRVLGTLTQPEMIRRILLYLGQRAEPLARAPARDPPTQQLGFDAAWRAAAASLHGFPMGNVKAGVCRVQGQAGHAQRMRSPLPRSPSVPMSRLTRVTL